LALEVESHKSEKKIRHTNRYDINERESIVDSSLHRVEPHGLD